MAYRKASGSTKDYIFAISLARGAWSGRPSEISGVLRYYVK
ncbi:hypothetical protein [Bacillus sp. ISL-7]|nr:hypothetical protein [Bacillus sp. ISL-7]